MAKIEAELYGNFDIILMDLHNTVMRGSTSASLEESSDIVVGSTRCAIRAYERYSYLGSGRVSMNVTLVPDRRQNIRFGNVDRRQSGGILQDKQDRRKLVS